MAEMKWPWSKPAPRPTIPPYQIPVSKRETPKDAGIEVKEGSLEDLGIDVDAMSRTGVHRAWRKLTGQDPDT